MATTQDLNSLGRVVARLEDAALDARKQAPLDDRLARVRAALGRRRAIRRTLSLLDTTALYLTLGAVVAALLLQPHHAPRQAATGRPQAPGIDTKNAAAPSIPPTEAALSDGTTPARPTVWQSAAPLSVRARAPLPQQPGAHLD